MSIGIADLLNWIGWGALGVMILCILLLDDKKRILKSHHHKSTAPYLKMTLYPPLHTMTPYGLRLVRGYWGSLLTALLSGHLAQIVCRFTIFPLVQLSRYAVKFLPTILRCFVPVFVLITISGCGKSAGRSSEIPLDELLFSLQLDIDSESTLTEFRLTLTDSFSDDGPFPSYVGINNRPTIDEATAFDASINNVPLELSIDPVSRNVLTATVDDVEPTSVSFELTRSLSEQLSYQLELADDLVVEPLFETGSVILDDQLTVGVSLQSRSGQIIDSMMTSRAQVEVGAQLVSCTGPGEETAFPLFSSRLLAEPASVPISASEVVEVSRLMPIEAIDGLQAGRFTSCSAVLEARYRVVDSTELEALPRNGLVLSREEQPGNRQVSSGTVLYARRTIEVLP